MNVHSVHYCYLMMYIFFSFPLFTGVEAISPSPTPSTTRTPSPTPSSYPTITPPPLPSIPFEDHPRIILTPSRIAVLKAYMRENTPDINNFFNLLILHANYLLRQPVNYPYFFGGQSDYLFTLRYSRDIILTTATAHIFRSNSSNTTYLDRCLREVNALCTNFSTTWGNPGWGMTWKDHLSISETMHAVAIAYDWLYYDMNTTFRTLVANTLIYELSLSYRYNLTTKYDYTTNGMFWVNSTSNWNCVSASGPIATILALWNETTAQSWLWSDIMQPIVTSVATCYGAYSPDSSWTEGPGYWSYASTYVAWTLSSLYSVLNNTAGLQYIDGVAGAGRFPIYMTGSGILQSTAITYNYGDANSPQEWVPTSQFFGLFYGDKAASYYSRMVSNTLALNYIKSNYANGYFADSIIFYDPNSTINDLGSLPMTKYYPYGRVAVVRSNISSPIAYQHYLAAKGGDGTWGHAHLDHGSFVYDYAGSRFAEDMGMESYALPQYFGALRYTYYRSGSWGHNLLLFNKKSHSSAATVASTIPLFVDKYQQPIEILTPWYSNRYSSKVSVDAYFVVNLTSANGPIANLSSHLRGFISLERSSAVIIVDEFRYNTNAIINWNTNNNITWQLHTQAYMPKSNGIGTTILTTMDPTVTNFTLARSLTRNITVNIIPHISTLTECNFNGWANTSVPSEFTNALMKPAWGYNRIDAVFRNPDPLTCTKITISMGNSSALDPIVNGGAILRPISEWWNYDTNGGPFVTPVPTKSATASASASGTRSSTASGWATVSAAGTGTASCSSSSTSSSSSTASATGSSSSTSSSTSTYSATVTGTSTGTFSTGASFSSTPSLTSTSSSTSTGTTTDTPSSSTTSTSTISSTGTGTGSSSGSLSTTSTYSATVTSTSTGTFSAGASFSSTTSVSLTSSSTSTSTGTGTGTSTGSVSAISASVSATSTISFVPLIINQSNSTVNSTALSNSTNNVSTITNNGTIDALPPDETRSSSVATIVGGAVGGVIGAAVVTAAVVYAVTMAKASIAAAAVLSSVAPVATTTVGSTASTVAAINPTLVSGAASSASVGTATQPHTLLVIRSAV